MLTDAYLQRHTRIRENFTTVANTAAAPKIASSERKLKAAILFVLQK